MILIVDFGSQTTHLIGRRLRQLGVPGISRVVYDITTKPPATMEWE